MTVITTLVRKLEKLGVFDRRAFVFEQEMEKMEREKRRSRHKRPERQINLPSGTGLKDVPFPFWCQTVAISQSEYKVLRNLNGLDLGHRSTQGRTLV